MRILGADPLVYALLFLGVVFSLVIGYVTQQRTLMPVINALIMWPFLIWSLRHARIDLALRLVCFWAFVVFLGAVVAGRLLGQEALAVVPGSVEYNAQQMYWLTGHPAAAIDQPSAWLPPFLRRTGLMLAGSALTGRVGSLGGWR